MASERQPIHALGGLGRPVSFVLICLGVLVIGPPSRGTPSVSLYGGADYVAGHRVVRAFLESEDTIDKWWERRFLDIGAIVEDTRGLIRAFGQEDDLAYDQSTGIWTSFKSKISRPFAERVAKDGTGRVWILSTAGYLRYFDGCWRQPQEPAVAPTFSALFPQEGQDSSDLRELDRPHCMFPTSDGRVLFVRNDEIGTFQGDSWLTIIAPPQEAEVAYSKLDRPRYNARAVPILPYTRSKFEPLSVQHLARRMPTLMLSEVYCGVQDREGSIWLGADRAIVKFSPASGWKIHPLPSGLVDGAGIMEGRDGTLWIYDLFGDLASYDQRADKWAVYSLLDFVPKGALDIESLLRLQAQVDAVVSKTRSLTDEIKRENPGTSEDSGGAGPDDFESVPDSPLKISALYEDHRGQILVATNAGLVVFDPAGKRWQVATSKTWKIPGGRLLCFCEDRHGQIWLGGDAGIVVLAP